MSGALADTHALLWWLADDARLSDAARELIAAGEVSVRFSAASIWEIAIKSAVEAWSSPTTTARRSSRTDWSSSA